MNALQKCLLTLLLVAGGVQAQERLEFWPDATYDSAVPTPASVIGYELGDRVTRVHDVYDYFEALADYAPQSVRIVEYAESWEARPLIYAIITSPENLRNIDDIKSGMQRLRDPRSTDASAADSIIQTQKPVTWLSYAVHGDEISGPEAAMMTAYHLLAATNDDRVASIMNDTVVVIDPVQNPDGRQRFISRYETTVGLEPSADRYSAEHKMPWPAGRTNHYLFDLNRDWFARTQPEVRGRADAILEFLPVVVVDAHEMGSDNTYYFPPNAEPFNPQITERQKENLALYGQNNARWFDTYGIDYYTREVYDAFFPGYGDTWPMMYGAISMTFEQASSDGLRFRQYDGNVLEFREGIRNQFVASMATAETTAVNRERLLDDFYRYQVTAIEEGRTEDVRAFVLPTQADQPAANKLAGLLVQQGVEVGLATEPFSACGQRFVAGSYVINLDQPSKRRIRALLDRDVPLEEEFIARQETRRANNLNAQIYDVTGWSLPLMYNVESVSCSRRVGASVVPAGPELVIPGQVEGGTAEVAYLVPWGTRPAVRLLARALRDGIAVKSNDLAFTHQGRRYPAGTLIIDVADNDDDLAASMTALARETGAEVVAVDASWLTEGPSFGSNNVVRHSAPRVAIAWDEPTNMYTAGNTRFVVERQFDYPVTPIRAEDLGSDRLSSYQVLILPGGSSYASTLGEDGVAALKRWVEAGGVLIGVQDAMRFLADPDVDLLAVRRENAVVEFEEELGEEGDEEEEGSTVDGRYLTAEDVEASTVALNVSPDQTEGVIVRANVNGDHWLGAGVAEEIYVLADGRDIYTPIRINNGVNVARFADADELVQSGYLWEENRRQLAYKPFAITQEHGRGIVVGFTQNPNVRAFFDGLNVIFMNAVFRGSAHARPVR